MSAVTPIATIQGMGLNGREVPITDPYVVIGGLCSNLSRSAVDELNPEFAAKSPNNATFSLSVHSLTEHRQDEFLGHFRLRIQPGATFGNIRNHTGAG
jgi:hypothetical protein